MIVKMWIARDESGMLCLYLNKPRKLNHEWYSKDHDFIAIDKTWFPEIDWEDREPVEVQIKKTK